MCLAPLAALIKSGDVGDAFDWREPPRFGVGRRSGRRGTKPVRSGPVFPDAWMTTGRSRRKERLSCLMVCGGLVQACTAAIQFVVKPKDRRHVTAGEKKKRLTSTAWNNVGPIPGKPDQIFITILYT